MKYLRPWWWNRYTLYLEGWIISSWRTLNNWVTFLLESHDSELRLGSFISLSNGVECLSTKFDAWLHPWLMRLRWSTWCHGMIHGWMLNILVRNITADHCIHLFMRYLLWISLKLQVWRLWMICMFPVLHGYWPRTLCVTGWRFTCNRVCSVDIIIRDWGLSLYIYDVFAPIWIYLINSDVRSFGHLGSLVPLIIKFWNFLRCIDHTYVVVFIFVSLVNSRLFFAKIWYFSADVRLTQNVSIGVFGLFSGVNLRRVNIDQVESSKIYVIIIFLSFLIFLCLAILQTEMSVGS